MRDTGYYDKKGNKIKDGDTIIGKSIDGDILEYIVKWSTYRSNWIAENKNESYDVASSQFNKFEIKEAEHVS